MTVRALYDAVAPTYDAVVAATRYVGPAWLDRVLTSIPAPARAVDFGCANGALGRHMRSCFPSVQLTGFDISERMVTEARRSNMYDELFVHDLNLPVPQIDDASVQLVVALGFAEFLTDPASFLAEAARVLAPAGTLVMSFQEHWPEREGLAPRTTRSGVVTHHAYTAAEVAALVRSQRLCLQSIESVTGYVSGSGFACPYLMVRATREAALPDACDQV
jgi:predicted TPR repeat methyltransferase